MSAADVRSRIEPTEPQAEFLSNFDAGGKFNFFIGGVGSGKSHLGGHYALEMGARNPEVRGFIAANTYTQLWQSTLTAFYKVCKMYGVPVRPERPESAAKKKVLYLWDSVEVLCRSAENFDEWDGTEIGWFWLDEAKKMRAGVWGAVNERLRDVRCDALCGWVTSTPDGLNWLYDVSEDNPEVQLVHSLTAENRHLPADYVERLRRNFSPEMAAQQLEGKFVNVYAGQCYPNFSRSENGGQFTLTGDEILVGIDFNVEPGMHAYACQVRGEDLFVIDEIYIRGGDTPSLAREIERRYGVERVILFPDAAGGQRSTTGTSDHQLLREAGFRLAGPAKNPPIKNRVNAMNARLLNSLGQRRLFVDNSCRLLRNDLERCTWDILFSQSYTGALTHPGAALGYVVHQKFPFQAHGFALGLGNVFG